MIAVALGTRAALRKDSLFERMEDDSRPWFVVAIAIMSLLAAT